MEQYFSKDKSIEWSSFCLGTIVGAVIIIGIIVIAC